MQFSAVRAPLCKGFPLRFNPAQCNTYRPAPPPLFQHPLPLPPLTPPTSQHSPHQRKHDIEHLCICPSCVHNAEMREQKKRGYLIADPSPPCFLGGGLEGAFLLNTGACGGAGGGGWSQQKLDGSITKSPRKERVFPPPLCPSGCSSLSDLLWFRAASPSPGCRSSCSRSGGSVTRADSPHPSAASPGGKPLRSAFCLVSFPHPLQPLLHVSPLLLTAHCRCCNRG